MQSKVKKSVIPNNAPLNEVEHNENATVNLSPFNLLKEIERLKTEIAETKIDLRLMTEDYDNLMDCLPHIDTVESVAQEFQVGVETLQDLVKKEIIPHYVWHNKGEKIVCFCSKEVESFFENDVYVPKWQIPIKNAS